MHLAKKEPWISENPDRFAPWGLGCKVCHAARDHGFHDIVPKSAFSEFNFGASSWVGIQPLIRHGNHEERQGEKPGHRLSRDGGHDNAVASVVGSSRTDAQDMAIGAK